jgi:hypothetical protein
MAPSKDIGIRIATLGPVASNTLLLRLEEPLMIRVGTPRRNHFMFISLMTLFRRILKITENMKKGTSWTLPHSRNIYSRLKPAKRDRLSILMS